MNGNEKIIAMRKTGKRPGIVFLNDFSCSTDWTEYGDHATVSILPSEGLETIDLRFLVGMAVSVAGSSDDRAKRLFEACKAAGAATVAACGPATDRDPWGENAWCDVWHQPITETI